MSTLVEQLIEKMGLRDEAGVLERTTELLRLLELRASKMPLQVNEYAKIVLCADIAASLLTIAFDQEQALKLSGLRKTHYGNHKRMFEKLLDMQRVAGVKDICIQLGINEVCPKALELLQLYSRVVAAQRSDIDMAHPQYAAMAVYLAAKIIKCKIIKTKIQSFSNLRPTQWQDLEQRWNRFLAKHYQAGATATQQPAPAAEAHKDAAQGIKKASVTTTATEIEDYEQWKQRMLATAEAQLKQQQSEQRQMEKENIT